MKKQNYSCPEIEVVLVETEDILTISNTNGEGSGIEVFW